MLVKNYSMSYYPKKQLNIGLALLKVYLAFNVVRSHNFNKKVTTNKFILNVIIKSKIHVPCFFIMSFYFMNKDSILLDKNKYKNRFKRLLIPYILWPLIIWSLNNLLKLFFKEKYSTSFKTLKSQLLWGNNFLYQLWFQWDLIVMIIMFIIILCLFKKDCLFFLLLLLIFAYILQYSGLNKQFYDYLKPDKKQCLGRFSEMTPYAVTGFILAFFKIIILLNNYKIKTFIIFILIFNLIEKYFVFYQPIGITYQGIKLNIRAITLIFIFSTFPSEKITGRRIINIFKYITNYTAGVFYLHVPVIQYTKKFINPIKKKTFSGIIIIYLLSYFISFIGMKFFGRTELRNLFS